mmetsp:Transcript_16540/g.23143  ORF Transcript_16540/g.23143 Transcript_16540/m.23143 type:complete len:95 (+) Transcript_16540:3217-3501(+)
MTVNVTQPKLKKLRSPQSCMHTNNSKGIARLRRDETHPEKQTDRKTDRQTDRKTNRATSRTESEDHDRQRCIHKSVKLILQVKYQETTSYKNER